MNGKKTCYVHFRAAGAAQRPQNEWAPASILIAKNLKK
jgi:hypothetical protein